MFDIAPPENDSEAIKLGNKIRQWIEEGKPKPGEPKVEKSEDEDEHVENKEEIQKHDKEEPKKKKGRFGFLKR